jgi:hypothetical protein
MRRRIQNQGWCNKKARRISLRAQNQPFTVYAVIYCPATLLEKRKMLLSGPIPGNGECVIFCVKSTVGVEF